MLQLPIWTVIAWPHLQCTPVAFPAAFPGLPERGQAGPPALMIFLNHGCLLRILLEISLAGSRRALPVSMRAADCGGSRRDALRVRVDTDLDEVVRQQGGRLIRFDIAIGSIVAATHDLEGFLCSSEARRLRSDLGDLRTIARLLAQQLRYLDVDCRLADSKIDRIQQLLVFCVLLVDDLGLFALTVAERLAGLGQSNFQIEHAALGIRQCRDRAKIGGHCSTDPCSQGC